MHDGADNPQGWEYRIQRNVFGEARIIKTLTYGSIIEVGRYKTVAQAEEVLRSILQEQKEWWDRNTWTDVPKITTT